MTPHAAFQTALRMFAAFFTRAITIWSAPRRMSLMPAHTLPQSPLRRPDTTRTTPRMIRRAPPMTDRIRPQADFVIAMMFSPKRDHSDFTMSTTPRTMSFTMPKFFDASPDRSPETFLNRSPTHLKTGPSLSLRTDHMAEIAGMPLLRNQEARSETTGISFEPIVSLVSSKIVLRRSTFPWRVSALVAA